MTSRFPRLSRLLCIALLFASPLALAEGEVFETEAGAIHGYDPVAYHLEGAARQGAADITHEWQGATWHFATAANRDRFAQDPSRYAPKYGGYCAYGTAQGYKVSTRPDAFAVIDGALYLNYNGAVQRIWNKDTAGYIRGADGNWGDLEHLPYVSDDDSVARAKAQR